MSLNRKRPKDNYLSSTYQNMLQSQRERYENDPIFREHKKRLAHEYAESHKKQKQAWDATYRQLNKEKIKQTQKEYRKRNRAKLLIKKKEDYEKNKEYYNKLKRERYQQIKVGLKEYSSSTALKRKLRYKRQIIQHYTKGKNMCQCCGVKGWGFLTVDHVNGREENDRKTGMALLTQIVKNNFPKGFEILCWNCNCAKYFSGLNECPHRHPDGWFIMDELPPQIE